jgi:predicted alpha/beta hydrolase family esterase
MPDAETHFVGHSIGCQTVLRYLASLPKDSHAGRVALVAGWIERGSLTGLEPDDVSIAKPWVETPIDFAHAKSVCGPILALLSDDDPVVIPDNERRFREFVGAEVHIEHGKGHYSEDSGVKEVPVVLEFLTR